MPVSLIGEIGPIHAGGQALFHAVPFGLDTVNPVVDYLEIVQVTRRSHGGLICSGVEIAAEMAPPI